MFEHLNVLTKQSYRMTSRGSLPRLQETVLNMGSKVQNVLRAGGGGEATQCEESVLKKSQRLESGGQCVVEDGVCLPLEQLAVAIESGGTALSVGTLMVGPWLNY